MRRDLAIGDLWAEVNYWNFLLILLSSLVFIPSVLNPVPKLLTLIEVTAAF